MDGVQLDVHPPATDAVDEAPAAERVVVRFASNGNSDLHCVGGWSYPEENGRWAVGTESALVLNRPPGGGDWLLRLRLLPFVNARSIKHQRLEIFVNGTSLGPLRVSVGGLLERTIPHAMVSERDYIILRFIHPDAAGQAPDTALSDSRALAFFFHDAVLEPVPSGGQDRFYSKIISLGGRCEVAHQITRTFGRKTVPGFFDMLAASLDSVVQVVDANFEDFITLEQLAPLGNWETNTTHRLVQTRYNIGVVHAFRKQVSVEAQIRMVRRQFELAKEYWEDLAEEPGRVLFIHRVNTNHTAEDEFKERPVTPEDAQRLHDAIRRRVSGAQFDLLLVTNEGGFSENWAGSGVIHAPVRDVFPYDWQGDDGEWDEIWRRLRVRLDTSTAD